MIPPFTCPKCGYSNITSRDDLDQMNAEADDDLRRLMNQYLRSRPGRFGRLVKRLRIQGLAR